MPSAYSIYKLLSVVADAVAVAVALFPLRSLTQCVRLFAYVCVCECECECETVVSQLAPVATVFVLLFPSRIAAVNADRSHERRLRRRRRAVETFWQFLCAENDFSFYLELVASGRVFAIAGWLEIKYEEATARA